MNLIVTKKISREENGIKKESYIKAINDKFIKAHNLTQQEVVLLHLLHLGSITNKVCSLAYGYENGESAIRYLRERWGAIIETEKQKGLNIKNRYGQKTEYGTYYLKNPELYKDLLQCC